MGSSRVNFPYFWHEKDVDYVLEAIEFIGKFGWLFLPNYNFECDLGMWVSRDTKDQNKRVRLAENDDSIGFRQTIAWGSEMPFRHEKTDDLQSYMQKAKIHLIETVAKYIELKSFEENI